MQRTISHRTSGKAIYFKNKIPAALQRIYASRGITSEEQLDYSFNKLLPFTDLKGIIDAANYLASAIISKKRILIIGDFDADGATSTALAVSALKALGCQSVAYLVPNRFAYGYGLTPEIVDVALNWSPEIIITVDNGISSCEGVAYANKHGIGVVITDHHLPGATLPEAVAIVNPNQKGCPFPSKNLAGVGVIFYVMLALRRELVSREWFSSQNLAEPNMAHLLDLVALGSIADVVPLDHNNRILIAQGLKRIKSGNCRPGILALLEVAKRNPHNLTSQDLGFSLGPRLNAAGRLDDMSLGIECLLAPTIEKAREIAVQLNDLNLERQAIEAKMKSDAMARLENIQLNESLELPLGLCLYDSSWHQGVIGILAGRVKEKYHRPVIAFANANDEEIKGSARSIEGVHIRDVLDSVATKHPELITKFGGHAMAAGLTLQLKNLDSFAKAFTQELALHVQPDSLSGKIETDGILASQERNMELAEAIGEGGPWGQAFPEPLFTGTFHLVQQRLLSGKHLKLTLADSEGKNVEAIAFNVDDKDWPNYHCQTIRCTYRLSINEYQGQKKLQLMIEFLEAL